MKWLPFIVFLFSCRGQQSDQSDKGESNNRSDSNFYELLGKLPSLKIPLTFRSDRELSQGDSVEINKDLRAKLEAFDPRFNPYGKIYQTDKFIAVIAIGSADILIPVLVTFNKNGKIIDSFNLYQTASGDIGYYSVNITVLTKDKEILMRDSVLTRKLNKEGTDEIPGSDSVTISEKRFYINGDGRIEKVR